jgi:hypothetical protein
MVGGYHIAYRNALTMIYGIPTSIAVAAGFTGYAVTQLPVLVLGLIFLRTEGLTLQRVREVAQAGAGEASPQVAPQGAPSLHTGASSAESPSTRLKERPE